MDQDVLKWKIRKTLLQTEMLGLTFVMKVIKNDSCEMSSSNIPVN